MSLLKTMPSVSSAEEPDADQPESRIIQQAGHQLMTYGYGAFTMDDLARELGMSKKTLYVHFPSKEALITAVIHAFGAEIKRDADLVLGNRDLRFVEKLFGLVNGMTERLSNVHASLLRDLKRSAPDLYKLIEENRSKNILYILGRFIEQGQIAGMVRDDLNPVFAVEFYLSAIQGLTQPETLKRLNLPPREICPRAMDLFFSGLFTAAGRKEYEKLFPR